MKKMLSVPFADDLRRNRLLLVVAVLLAFLALAYCHLQAPAADSDAHDLPVRTNSFTSSNSSASSDIANDSDGDEVANEHDACPDEAGAAIDNGCPVDTDSDGIADLDDQCPNRAGAIDGCPEDSDGDGITDRKDTCPDAAGPAASQGCPPDSDGDGVGDAIDQCPQTSGNASLDGCPPESEPDNDSSDVVQENNSPINDDVIQNVNSATSTQDMDGDGVHGESDRCPEQFGDANDGGCPPDSDNDGIADIHDRCPTVTGDADAEGCEATASNQNSDRTLDARDQQILDDAIAKVAFDSNSATLTSDSRDLLSDVAGLMRKYSTATLEIRGHTDASGIADNNMQLSMARARSTAAYIVSIGIDVNRIRAFGYGESQPIADNNSPEGRRLNRGVEFDLLFAE